MSRRLILGLAAVAALSACGRDDADGAAANPAPAAAPAAATGEAHQFSPKIDPTDFAKRVEVLASDEFEGRAPGSAGEEKTVEYLR
ncbi:MAG TPA: aminopeptidase, partial [Pseudoxanthomonas sp.]|nr:aminopeptidase [Pseudoxanthomonas sp.]